MKLNTPTYLLSTGYCLLSIFYYSIPVADLGSTNVRAMVNKGQNGTNHGLFRQL